MCTSANEAWLFHKHCTSFTKPLQFSCRPICSVNPNRKATSRPRTASTPLTKLLPGQHQPHLDGK
uniref:Uncharacterized protein n=1 Tax=Anguilla anguilla TaxID=7936 RepID=A0A0E9RHF7_ANGAN